MTGAAAHRRRAGRPPVAAAGSVGSRGAPVTVQITIHYSPSTAALSVPHGVPVTFVLVNETRSTTMADRRRGVP